MSNELDFIQSIIRDGNHFIKTLPPHIDPGRWFLIDGPWFQMLESCKGRNPVVLARYIKIHENPDIAPPISAPYIDG